MEYTKLNKLRNTYPGDNVSVIDSYQHDNGSIKYTGKYPENFIKFDVLPLDDIKVGTLKTDPLISFRFIVQFFDGDIIEEWTSEPFLRDLLKAQQDNNPFFSRDRVTIAKINFADLTNYWKSDKFRIGEAYAEVKIVNTIETKEDILKHINWIVSSDEEIRDVESYGGWIVELTENLGFPPVVGNQTIDSNNIPENATTLIQQPMVSPAMQQPISSPQQPATQPKITIANNNPFSVSGNYNGEVRMSEKTGMTYTWNDSIWVLKT